jgi:hypothetical protein
MPEGGWLYTLCLSVVPVPGRFKPPGCAAGEAAAPLLRIFWWLSSPSASLAQRGATCVDGGVDWYISSPCAALAQRPHWAQHAGGLHCVSPRLWEPSKAPL